MASGDPLYLVELFLPLVDRKGERLPATLYRGVRTELVNKFGGLTAHLRAPAAGLWKPSKDARVERDVLVIYEVLTPGIREQWWSNYRRRLEKRFGQRKILIRAQPVRLL